MARRAHSDTKVMTMRKIVSLLILIGVSAGFFGQACTEFGGSNMNEFGSLNDAAGFSLSPATASVATGAAVRFVPVGGVPPFSWTVNNGQGTISPDGLFTAPSSATANGSVVTVMCTDSLGSQAFASVSVGGGFAATYTPNPAIPGSVVTIQINGGKAPYYVQQTGGSGSLTNLTYVPPTSPEVASFTITDSDGRSTSLSIPIGTTGGPTAGILELAMTQQGAHVPGGPGCPVGYTWSGSVADGTWDFTKNAPYFYGDIQYCMLVGTIQEGRPYVSDMYLGASCPNGFSAVASYITCTTFCFGNTVLCAKFSSGGEPPVRDFYVTQSGIHNPSGPNCNAGFTSIGKATDCGYGNCSGLQNFCIAK